MTIGVLITSIAPRREWRERCVKSVLDQTVVPDQLVVSIDHHRDGAITTRNRGLLSMHTEWTVLIDDDDYLLPNHIETVKESIGSTDADFIYTIPENGPRLRYGLPFSEASLRSGNYIHTGGVAFRTRMAQEVGGFSNAPGTLFEDYGLWLRLLDKGATFHHTPEITWHWNHHQDSTKGLGINW